MRDPNTFEARLADAFLRYADTAPPMDEAGITRDALARTGRRSIGRLGWPSRRALLWSAVALALSVGIGVAVLGSPDANVSTPSASPEPTATSSPTIRPPRTAHRAEFGMTYDTPDGWSTLSESDARLELLTSTGGESLEGITFFRNAVIADQDAACSQTQKPGLGPGVDDLVAYLTTHPGLVTSTPEPVAIGGLSGTAVDLSLAPSWTQVCPFNGVRTVMFLTGVGGGYFFWGVDDVERQRLAILDDGQGGTIVIAINSRSASGFDSFVRTTAPILESLSFDPRPAPTLSPPSASP